MDPRRVFAARAEGEVAPDRNEVATRRLALIAADLGRSTGTSAMPGDPTDPATDVPPGDTREPWWAGHTRVAAETARPGEPSLAPVLPLPLPDEPETIPAAPARAETQTARPAPRLPTPGRHAARRRGAALAVLARERLPSLGPAHLAVVALAVAAALAVTTWWVIRDQPGPAPAGAPVAGELAAPLVAAEASASTPPSGSAAAADGAQVTVDVAGKVRRPGIVVLDQGARVTDALKAAGGPKRGVDTTALNLARVLVDGEQIVVGAPGGAASDTGAAPPSSGGAAPGQLVNLNTATASELEALPQVGPVTAQAIVAWRDQNGGFTSVDELLEVDGIGEKTLAQLTPYVTV